MARTFVALWPQAEAAHRLGDQAAGIVACAGARCLPARDLHLTLAFIGELPGDALSPLGQQIAGQLRAAGVRLPGPHDSVAFDQVGSFRGANVAWLGLSQPPPWLAPLAQAVRDALDAAGVSYDRKPFVPHLTVARGVRVDTEPIEPIVTQGWRAALACSMQREDAHAPGRYRIAAWLS